jgi:hypothetical protein
LTLASTRTVAPIASPPFLFSCGGRMLRLGASGHQIRR